MRPRSSPAARSVYVITSSDSTSMPSSQTARTKRSTSTVVLPVPAPAETKTWPRAAVAALGVVHDVARLNPLREATRQLARALDLAPEGLLVEVVVLREARHAVVLRLEPKQAARLALAGQRPVEAAEGLDPDEVAEDE